METIFMNTENSKTNEPHKFRLSLSDKLNLKNPNKNIALGNLSIYYTWKNIKSTYNNNKCKFSAPTWILLIYLVVHILLQTLKDYFEFIIQKHKTLTEDSPIEIYPNRIKNRIAFKIKTSYKLELLTPELMRLLGSTKEVVHKDKMVKLCQN